MSYTNIGTAIYNIINGIKAAAGIAVVFNYNEKSLAQYPCVTISAVGHGGEFSDTAANMRTYVFAIRLSVRAETDSTAESQIRTITDAIISAIEANTALSGACDWSEPSEGTISYQNNEIPVLMCEMVVKCYKRTVVR